MGEDSLQNACRFIASYQLLPIIMSSATVFRKHLLPPFFLLLLLVFPLLTPSPRLRCLLTHENPRNLNSRHQAGPTPPHPPAALAGARRERGGREVGRARARAWGPGGQPQSARASVTRVKRCRKVTHVSYMSVTCVLPQPARASVTRVKRRQHIFYNRFFFFGWV